MSSLTFNDDSKTFFVNCHRRSRLGRRAHYVVEVRNRIWGIFTHVHKKVSVHVLRSTVAKRVLRFRLLLGSPIVVILT